MSNKDKNDKKSINNILFLNLSTKDQRLNKNII